MSLEGLLVFWRTGGALTTSLPLAKHVVMEGSRDWVSRRQSNEQFALTVVRQVDLLTTAGPTFLSTCR
jgi:hypothetical protein